jgi:hypothetical protein
MYYNTIPLLSIIPETGAAICRAVVAARFIVGDSTSISLQSVYTIARRKVYVLFFMSVLFGA